MRIISICYKSDLTPLVLTSRVLISDKPFMTEIGYITIIQSFHEWFLSRLEVSNRKKGAEKGGFIVAGKKKRKSRN